jgi:alkylated DNA repair dioxygenase AlkB
MMDREWVELEGGEVRLVRGFLGAEEGERLYVALAGSIGWERRAIRMFGREVMQPRLVAWHGDAGVSYRYSGLDWVAAGWTPELAEIRSRVEGEVGARFNSVLCNWYRGGDDSMGWHSDDERELGGAPVIGSVSLGAARRFQFRRRDGSGDVVSLELGHGSLLVMAGATQRLWQHRVPKAGKREGEVGGRINLTFRLVGGSVSR